MRGEGTPGQEREEKGRRGEGKKEEGNKNKGKEGDKVPYPPFFFLTSSLAFNGCSKRSI